MSAHWYLPVNDLWTCQRCGDNPTYGAKRTLWSLLPFVCTHRPVSYDDLVERDSSWKETCAYLDLGKSIPAIEHGIKGWLRSRLSDEVKGYRKHWWLGRIKTDQIRA